jgi:hypothetical protein
MQFLRDLIFPGGFMPHGHTCLSIPIARVHFTRKRRGISSSKEERDLTATCDLGVGNHPRKPVDFEKFHKAVHTLALYWLMVNQTPPRQSMTDCTEKPA